MSEKRIGKTNIERFFGTLCDKNMSLLFPRGIKAQSPPTLKAGNSFRASQSLPGSKISNMCGNMQAHVGVSACTYQAGKTRSQGWHYNTGNPEKGLKITKFTALFLGVNPTGTSNFIRSLPVLELLRQAFMLATIR